MRAFLIFATLVVAALARPDIGLELQKQQGYDYSAPSSHSGGGGGHSSHGGNGYQQQTFGTNQGSSNGGGFGGQSSGGHSGGHSSGGHSSGGHSSGGHSSGGHSSGGQSGNGYQQQTFGTNQGSSNGGGFGGQSSGGHSGGHSSGGHSSGGNSGGFGGNSGGDLTYGQSRVIDLTGGSSGGGSVIYKPVIRQGEPIVTKHFYVHEAPEEAENARVEEKVQEVRPQKHYKIIFIKAPSSGGANGASNYPVYPQNEEKTIVYVLSKKDENNFENGEFPTPPPAVTSKPEVFFVKYKTKEEADSAVSKIQESFQEGGAGYNSPASFADSLGATSGGASSSSFTQGGSSGGSPSGFSQGGSSQVGKSDIRGSNDFESQDFGVQQDISSSSGNGFQSVSTGGSVQSQGGNGGGHSGHSGHSSFSGSFPGSDNQIVPQQMLEIPSDNSVFRSEYLPPGQGKK